MKVEKKVIEKNKVWEGVRERKEDRVGQVQSERRK